MRNLAVYPAPAGMAVLLLLAAGGAHAQVITQVTSVVSGGPASINTAIEEQFTSSFTNIENSDPASYYPERRVNVTNLNDPRRWDGACITVGGVFSDTQRCDPVLTGVVRTSGIVDSRVQVPDGGGAVGLPAVSVSEVRLDASLSGDNVLPFSTGFSAATTTQSYFFLRRTEVPAGVVLPASVDVEVDVTVNYNFELRASQDWLTNDTICSSCFANSRLTALLSVGSLLPGGIPNEGSSGGLLIDLQGFRPGADLPTTWQAGAQLNPDVEGWQQYLLDTFNQTGVDLIRGQLTIPLTFTVPLGDPGDSEWFRSAVMQTTSARAGIGGERNDTLLTFNPGLNSASASARSFIDPLFDVKLDLLGELAPYFEVYYPDGIFPLFDNPDDYFAGIPPDLRESYRAALEDYHGVSLGETAVVPLPATGWLLLSAAGGLAWRAAGRRRRIFQRVARLAPPGVQVSS